MSTAKTGHLSVSRQKYQICDACENAKSVTKPRRSAGRKTVGKNAEKRKNFLSVAVETSPLSQNIAKRNITVKKRPRGRFFLFSCRKHLLFSVFSGRTCGGAEQRRAVLRSRMEDARKPPLPCRTQDVRDPPRPCRIRGDRAMLYSCGVPVGTAALALPPGRRRRRRFPAVLAMPALASFCS